MDNITHKKCSRCKQLKPISEFYRHKTSIDGYRYDCKKCNKEDSSNYHKRDRENHIKQQQQYRHTAREKAISYYGGKCACCGETHKEFLAIDHINGGGHKHIKSINGLAIGIWLKINNYPAGFRVLCHNCNMSLGIFGYCPHQQILEFDEKSKKHLTNP